MFFCRPLQLRVRIPDLHCVLLRSTVWIPSGYSLSEAAETLLNCLRLRFFFCANKPLSVHFFPLKFYRARYWEYIVHTKNVFTTALRINTHLEAYLVPHAKRSRLNNVSACVRVVGGKRKNTQDAQMAIKTFVWAKTRGEQGLVDKDINTRNTLFIIIRGFVLYVRHGEKLWFIGLANSWHIFMHVKGKDYCGYRLFCSWDANANSLRTTLFSIPDRLASQYAHIMWPD